MSSQTTLTEDAPMILDATCSFSKIWPAHATVRIDIRPECKPDVVMDARDLKFPDSTFDEIYCDPPHMFRRGGLETIRRLRRIKYHRLSPDPFTRYGTWGSEEEWFDFIDKTNAEFYRCLKPTGTLHYKITEGSGCTELSDLLARMTNFKLVSDKSSPSIGNRFSKNATAKAHFLTMKPVKAEAEAQKAGAPK